MKKECEFCRRYELALIIKKETDRERRAQKEPKIYREYSVAFLEQTWTRSKGKRRASRLTDYRHLGLGYKLYYCPECGKCLTNKAE